MAEKLESESAGNTTVADAVSDAINQDQANQDQLSLGQKVSEWTSNFLGTAVVVLVAIVFGSYLVSSWQFDDQPPSVTVAEVVGAWPQLEKCSLEFGDSTVQLEREKFLGTKNEVLEKLTLECRKALQLKASPTAPVGKAERAMIERMDGEQAVAQVAGEWRIYFVAELPGSGQFPQVIGIRDDCANPSLKSEKVATAETDWPSSRLVTWGVAMPVEKESWTTYVSKASTGSSQLGVQGSLVPTDAKRTLGMWDPNRASVVGFSGGSLADAKLYYLALAEKNDWKIVSQWHQSGNNWNASFASNAESKLEGIQVRLHVNHNQPLRGLVTLTARRLSK